MLYYFRMHPTMFKAPPKKLVSMHQGMVSALQTKVSDTVFNFSGGKFAQLSKPYNEDQALYDIAACIDEQRHPYFGFDTPYYSKN